MTPDELEGMKHMWDGSESWTLHAFNYSQADLTIEFQGERSTIQELISLRKLLDEYRHMPVSELKAKAGASKSLSIGRWSGSDAHYLMEEASRLGLHISEVDKSYTAYIPEGPHEEAAFILDEDFLVDKRVIQKMLEAGVPVVWDIEVD